MENQQTVGSQFKALKIIHGALCVGVVIILAVFRFLVKNDNTSSTTDMQLFQIIGAVIGFIGVLTSRLMFFTRTRTAMGNPSLAEKITIYRGALILQLALLEGPAIINAVFYFITKNDLHFFIALGLLLFMVFARPTRMMAGMLLFNEMEDKQQIHNDNIIL